MIKPPPYVRSTSSNENAARWRTTMIGRPSVLDAGRYCPSQNRHSPDA